jgi:hypothetical protein
MCVCVCVFVRFFLFFFKWLIWNSLDTTEMCLWRKSTFWRRQRRFRFSNSEITSRVKIKITRTNMHSLTNSLIGTFWWSKSTFWRRWRRFPFSNSEITSFLRRAFRYVEFSCWIILNYVLNCVIAVCLLLSGSCNAVLIGWEQTGNGVKGHTHMHTNTCCTRTRTSILLYQSTQFRLVENKLELEREEQMKYVTHTHTHRHTCTRTRTLTRITKI